MSDAGGSGQQVREVAAPFGEEWAAAETLGVMLQGLPVDGGHELLGLLDAAVEGAAPVAVGPLQHRTRALEVASSVALA